MNTVAVELADKRVGEVLAATTLDQIRDVVGGTAMHWAEDLARMDHRRYVVERVAQAARARWLEILDVHDAHLGLAS